MGTCNGMRHAAVAVGLALSALTSSAPALANSGEIQCAISKVAWRTDGDDGERLQFVCNNMWYYAFKNKAGCTPRSSDTLKAWLSIAQAAVLAGKTVYVGYTQTPYCKGTEPELYLVELWQ